MDDFVTKFQALAATAKKIMKSIAQADTDLDDSVPMEQHIKNMQHGMSALASQIDCLGSALSYHMDSFSDHKKGHLPPVKSNEQMKRAVAALGLEDEYDVPKSTISARGNVFYIG